MEFKDELWQNIVLAGGSTMFPCFQEKVTQEFVNKMGLQKKLRVTANQKRNYAVWVGGS